MNNPQAFILTMEDTSNRKLEITRTFRVPITVMWDAWTDPVQIIHWWGPNGFTNTIQHMDFRVGGEWKFTMHSPDGKNYPNRSIYREIIPLQKILFEHFNPHFIATIEFEQKGQLTTINWTMLFDSIEMADTIINIHKADEGQKQNLDRLENHLSKFEGR